MEIVFATNNLNKIKEVQSLLPSNITILSLESIGCNEEIPETKNTIEENAIQKADYIKEHYGLNCFADDTGLEVNALNSSPGVYSARYAGPEKCSESNMKLLLSKLKLISDRSAQFKTVIALNINGKTLIFEGICKGEISHEKKGKGGFGYDPIFQVTETNCRAAELDKETKNKVSHRGKAIARLLQRLQPQ